MNMQALFFGDSEIVASVKRTDTLNGKRILIVEAEFLIALEIQRILEAAGAGETVFARSTAEVAKLSEVWDRFDLAIIDLSLGDDRAVALAHELGTLGIGLVITSSDVRLRHGVDGLPDVPVILKPFAEDEFVAACQIALSSRQG